MTLDAMSSRWPSPSAWSCVRSEMKPSKVAPAASTHIVFHTKLAGAMAAGRSAIARATPKYSAKPAAASFT